MANDEILIVTAAKCLAKLGKKINKCYNLKSVETQGSIFLSHLWGIEEYIKSPI